MTKPQNRENEWALQYNACNVAARKIMKTRNSVAQKRAIIYVNVHLCLQW